MIFSDNQIKIFDFVENTNKSLAIDATAGSGKTTTIVHAATLIDPNLKTLFCAFGKAIAVELKERLPESVDSKTLNSLGYTAYLRSEKLKPGLNKNKLIDIISKSAKVQRAAPNKYFLGKLQWQIKSLVEYAKANGVGILVKDTPDAWKKLIIHNAMILNAPDFMEYTMKETEEAVIKIARLVFKISNQNKKVLDFSDQLFFPLYYNSKFIKYDVIFVDEAQDLSGIQREILSKSLKSGGRVIAVGDKHQSIYGFRAADINSMEQITKEFGCESLPLSITYRCPVNVVELAKMFSPDIEAAPNAPLGEVITLEDGLSYVSLDPETTFLPNDLVLCRNSGPLLKLAFWLLDNQIPVSIKGDEIKKTIMGMLNRFDCMTTDSFLDQVEEWHDTETARILKENEFASVKWIKDCAELSATFVDLSGFELIEDTKKFLKEFFTTNKSDCVELSTIHKSKGLEADRVHILDYGLLPSKYATEKWMLVQEKNLAFVALTRSKNFLSFITTPKDL